MRIFKKAFLLLVNYLPNKTWGAIVVNFMHEELTNQRLPIAKNVRLDLQKTPNFYCIIFFLSKSNPTNS
jgi:hypothetical protein